MALAELAVELFERHAVVAGLHVRQCFLQRRDIIGIVVGGWIVAPPQVQRFFRRKPRRAARGFRDRKS